MTFDRDEMLAAFREQRGPSDEVVERMATRLRALGPAPESGTVIELAASRRVGRTTRIAIAIGALAAAVALGWFIRGVALSPADEVDRSIAPDRVEREASGGTARVVRGGEASREKAGTIEAPAIEAPAIEAPAIEAPAIEPATEAVAPADSPRTASSRPAMPRPPRNPARAELAPAEAPAIASDAPPPPPEPDTLAEEIAIVRRARAELSRGRAQQTLAILSDYADRFPKGSLAEEVAAVRTMAQCRLRSSDAAQLAAAFATRFAKSIFRGQVDAACRPAQDDE